MKRTLLSLLAPAALAVGLAGCCGDCIKDPPCKCWESPCCLTDLQRTALKAKTHALQYGPVAYTYGGHPFVLFTEKGQADFEKDPATYEAKGAIVLIRGDSAVRVDIDPGEGYDFGPGIASARPFSK